MDNFEQHITHISGVSLGTFVLAGNPHLEPQYQYDLPPLDNKNPQKFKY